MIPSSVIHGDFSIGNIIVSDGNVYIIDWELSRHDFLIRDMYKVLNANKEIFDFVDKYMQNEIQTKFPNNSSAGLTTREQYLFEKFRRSLLKSSIKGGYDFSQYSI
jgi:thiamine kinase-like enzyme